MFVYCSIGELCRGGSWVRYVEIIYVVFDICEYFVEFVFNIGFIGWVLLLRLSFLNCLW